MPSDLHLTGDAAVRDAVAGMVHALDRRDWPALRRHFAEAVTTDYTSLFGGEVQRQPADDLIAGWRRLLSPLDATQHLLGPITVALADERATAECHVRGYHVAARAPGGPEWLVAGHYVVALVRAGAVWRIDHLTLETAYQTGNRDLLAEVAAVDRPRDGAASGEARRA